MITLVTKCKLLCQDADSQGYITYVFELLESEEMNRLGTKYVMCVRWPNWDHRVTKWRNWFSLVFYY